MYIMHYILKENTEEDYCEGIVDSQNYRTEAVQEEEQRTGL